MNTLFTQNTLQDIKNRLSVLKLHLNRCKDPTVARHKALHTGRNLIQIIQESRTGNRDCARPRVRFGYGIRLRLRVRLRLDVGFFLRRPLLRIRAFRRLFAAPGLPAASGLCRLLISTALRTVLRGVVFLRRSVPLFAAVFFGGRNVSLNLCFRSIFCRPVRLRGLVRCIICRRLFSGQAAAGKKRSRQKNNHSKAACQPPFVFPNPCHWLSPHSSSALPSMLNSICAISPRSV